MSAVVAVVLAVALGALAVVALRWRARAERAEAALVASAGVDVALEEAAALRAHLQLAIDAIPQGVLVVDLGGEVVARNAVAAVYAEGRHGDALVGAAIDELVADALEGLPGRRTVELYETPRRTLVITATPLDEDGQRAGALVVVEDVSERRRLDAVRRDFVANISHELKTPVAAMSLLAETLAAEDDPAVAHRLAERIQLEAFRVGRTIEDLLALSRIEADEDIERDLVPVVEIIDDACDRTRAAAERAEIVVSVDLGDPELVVDGDRRQIVSALANLIDNAIKYSDPGSEVVVGAHARDDTIDLSVADQGIGIPARDLERVFERFYRVDQARSRETGGTGLGLAIVRHVAVNHGGTVDVASRTGVGSTFTLRLPATGASSHSSPSGLRPSPAEPVALLGARPTSGER